VGDGIDYDVIVVGSGPAGLVAGEYAAKCGARTLVVDRKREVGSPVRCAEGLGAMNLKLLDLDPTSDFIMNTLNRAHIISPSGKRLKIYVPYKEFSLHVLDRSGFEKELAKRFKDNGGEILLGTTVVGLKREGGKITGVRTAKGDITGKVIIGCDGVESRIGRFCGLTKRLNMNQIFSTAQCMLVDMEGVDDHFEIQFGQRYAPGGYAWLFPKGKGEVNLGLGILGTHKKKSIEFLREFKKDRAPDAQFTRFVTGCIPSTLPPPKTVKDNILLVGDSARQTNAVSGGGIANAIKAGKIAGKIAGKVASENLPISRLEEYETLWRAELEKTLTKKFKQRRYLESDRKNERIFKLMKLAYFLKPIIPKNVIVRWLTPDF
jgi:digeranylgeranylglycerophospholipid reductase